MKQFTNNEDAKREMTAPVIIQGHYYQKRWQRRLGKEKLKIMKQKGNKRRKGRKLKLRKVNQYKLRKLLRRKGTRKRQ